MKLSIVATLYQSARHIDQFYRRVVNAARSVVGDDYEIVFVNDGSTDDGLKLAVELTHHDPKVVVIDLSRNFGHYKAMMTGLAYTRGEQVFLIDSDLEEKPEWLIPFSSQMAKDQCDVVYGVQERRKGNWFERWSGSAFYFLFNQLAGITLPKNIVTARLMTRRYTDALLDHKEREVFIAGIWHITGFDQRPQTVKKHSRNKSTYTFRRKISVLVNSITSFSDVPLIGIFYSGILISLIAGLYVIYIVFNWLYVGSPPSGWTSLIASIWLLGGLIISFIGVLGIYLSKIFSETKQRPYSIIRQIYGSREE